MFLGFGSKSSRVLGVWDLGFRVWGLGFRVLGDLGCEALSPRQLNPETLLRRALEVHGA